MICCNIQSFQRKAKAFHLLFFTGKRYVPDSLHPLSRRYHRAAVHRIMRNKDRHYNENYQEQLPKIECHDTKSFITEISCLP